MALNLQPLDSLPGYHRPMSHTPQTTPATPPAPPLQAHTLTHALPPNAGGQVERKSAVRNFEGIAHVADGIIVSRGNLGLDFEPEVRAWGACAAGVRADAGPRPRPAPHCWMAGENVGLCAASVHRLVAPAMPGTAAAASPVPRPQAVALLQKRIVSRCNHLGKPVLITRVVDTMVTVPRPTRAGGAAQPSSPSLPLLCCSASWLAPRPTRAGGASQPSSPSPALVPRHASPAALLPLPRCSALWLSSLRQTALACILRALLSSELPRGARPATSVACVLASAATSPPPPPYHTHTRTHPLITTRTQ